MRILLDANLPKSASAAIAKTGHTPVSVRDIGLADAPDEQIATYARENQLCMATRDFDFADVRNYPPENYAGIVVLDLPDHSVAAQISALISRFFSRADLEGILPGRLAIVRATTVRFRPKLPD